MGIFNLRLNNITHEFTSILSGDMYDNEFSIIIHVITNHVNVEFYL